MFNLPTQDLNICIQMFNTWTPDLKFCIRMFNIWTRDLPLKTPKSSILPIKHEYLAKNGEIAAPYRRRMKAQWGFHIPHAQSKTGDEETKTNGTFKRKEEMRIEIPSNPDQFITLAKAVFAQHTKLGAASPLNGIKGIASFGAQVTAADTNNAQTSRRRLAMTRQAVGEISMPINLFGEKTKETRRCHCSIINAFSYYEHYLRGQ